MFLLNTNHIEQSVHNTNEYAMKISTTILLGSFVELVKAQKNITIKKSSINLPRVFRLSISSMVKAIINIISNKPYVLKSGHWFKSVSARIVIAVGITL